MRIGRKVRPAKKEKQALKEASKLGGGITDVTRGPAALTGPTRPDETESLRYGLGFPFQIAPRKAVLLCNLRNEGFPVGDFENGVDAIVFDDPAAIRADHAIPIMRNKRYVNERTRKPRIVLHFPIMGGFVPLEAMRADGTPHPHAGTGFGFNQAFDFPMKGHGYYDKADKRTSMIRKTELRQFAFDGEELGVLSAEARAPRSSRAASWSLLEKVRTLASGVYVRYAIW